LGAKVEIRDNKEILVFTGVRRRSQSPPPPIRQHRHSRSPQRKLRQRK
jgi:hypothetical protein